MNHLTNNIMLTDEFFEDLQRILHPGLFTELANGFAHYADSDIIRREYRDLRDDPAPANTYERHPGVVTYQS